MELHERLVTTKPKTSAAPPPTKEPFADLKNEIHMLVITELGPQMTGQVFDPVAMRDRVLADIRRHLSTQTGISRDDRERLTSEIADDILGYGPLERLLADDSITEIMVNGPGEIWIERQGRLYETTVRFSDDSHLRRIINRMVAQIGRRIDESSPMVDARLPDGSRVNAVIAPLSLSGPLLTIRSLSGIADDSAFRRVVFPEPVPPEMSTFSCAWMQRLRKSTDSSFIEPRLIMSCSPRRLRENFRIVSSGPDSESGWMIAFTREPSGRRASTIGDDSSMRRPICATIRLMMRRRCESSVNRTVVS